MVILKVLYLTSYKGKHTALFMINKNVYIKPQKEDIIVYSSHPHTCTEGRGGGDRGEVFNTVLKAWEACMW